MESKAAELTPRQNWRPALASALPTPLHLTCAHLCPGRAVCTANRMGGAFQVEGRRGGKVGGGT